MTPGKKLAMALAVGSSGAAVSRRDEDSSQFKRQAKWNRFPSQQIFDELDVRYKGFSGPIGSGKSKALVMEAVKMAYLNPGVEGLVGAPTYTMLRSSTGVELQSTLEEHGIPHKFVWSSSNMHVEMKEPGSTILLRSLEAPERLRGMNLGWFGVDELSYCREDAWLRLQGRLRNPKARKKRGFAVWTPKGKDWVWRSFISSDKVANFFCVQARPFENRAVLDKTPDFYENLKLQYDERFYRQEVLGEYIEQSGGAVYHAFNEKNVRDQIPFDPTLPLVACFDFNINPMTCVLGQMHEEYGRRRFYALREIALRESHVVAMCEEFVRRTSDWQRGMGRTLQVHAYGDATGGNAHAASMGETCWSLITKFFARQENYRLTMRVPRSNPTVVERINSMNAALCSFGEGHREAGQRTLFVDRSCKELIRDFEEVLYLTDSSGAVYPEIDKGRDYKRTHLSDALGYFVHAEMGIRSTRGRVQRSGLVI